MPRQESHFRRLVRQASHAPARSGGAPVNAGSFVRALAGDPTEILWQVLDAVSPHLTDDQVIYHVGEDDGSPFHQRLSVPWPGSELKRGSRVRADVGSSPSAKGLSLCRGTYEEYSDDDRRGGTGSRPAAPATDQPDLAFT